MNPKQKLKPYHERPMVLVGSGFPNTFVMPLLLQLVPIKEDTRHQFNAKADCRRMAPLRP
eukprot:1429351-Amphidinium_carterae.1